MRLRALFLPALLLLSTFQVLTMAQADAVPTQETAEIPALGTVTSATLANGLRVVIAPSQAADLVTVDAWVGAGTRRETRDTNGVAHFMEHLLFKGTKTRLAGQIDAEIEDLGGTLNGATSYDWAHFYVTVGASDAEPALAVLSDALMNAELRQEDLDHERPVILSEMARQLSTPEGRMTRTFNALTFPTHPYGRPLLGTEDTISHMTRQTVLDFYHTYYVPANLTLVLSGRITPEAGVALAKKYLGAWPNKPVPADSTLAEPEQTDIRVRNLRGNGTRAFLTLGFRAPSVHTNPDAYVMDVLLTLLGQAGANRLHERLEVKKKIVSNVTSNYLTQRDPGTLTISASCDASQVNQARDAILAEIADLRDNPITDQEMASAKHALLASYLFDAQTTNGRADALGFYSTIDTYRYDTHYIQNFEAITPAQLQAVAQKYLKPTAYTLVTILPALDPVTASFSPLVAKPELVAATQEHSR